MSALCAKHGFHYTYFETKVKQFFPLLKSFFSRADLVCPGDDFLFNRQRCVVHNILGKIQFLGGLLDGILAGNAGFHQLRHTLCSIVSGGLDFFLHRRAGKDKDNIKDKCKNFDGNGSCSGCKWYPDSSRTRFFDCRGFTYWVLAGLMWMT